MNKKYYYNLKLTEEEFSLLSLICTLEYLKDKEPKFREIDDMLEKILHKLAISGEKVNKLKKEDNKCQNHK